MFWHSYSCDRATCCFLLLFFIPVTNHQFLDVFVKWLRPTFSCRPAIFILNSYVIDFLDQWFKLQECKYCYYLGDFVEILPSFLLLIYVSMLSVLYSVYTACEVLVLNHDPTNHVSWCYFCMSHVSWWYLCTVRCKLCRRVIRSGE